MTTLAFLAVAASELTPEQSERVGVYVLAAIVGLVVTGLIACAKQIRKEITRPD